LEWTIHKEAEIVGKIWKDQANAGKMFTGIVSWRLNAPKIGYTYSLHMTRPECSNRVSSYYWSVTVTGSVMFR
jgi:hypothetical protein